jgi:hypothetical protein
MPVVLIPLQPYAWPPGSTPHGQKKVAKAQCIATFANLTYVNLASGDQIRVTGGGIKHSLHLAHPPLMRALWVLQQAIADATPLGTFPDKHGRPDILSARKYEIDFDDAGTQLVGQIVAREHAGPNGTTYLQFYDLAFIKT